MAKSTYPKGTWFQPKRLATTGEKVRYGYFGRGAGSIALGREGTPEFHERLAEAMRKEPQGDTFSKLRWDYLQSEDFEKLQPLTKRDYRKFLDVAAEKFGPLSLAAMQSPKIVDHLYAWRDSMKASPRRADYAVTVLKAVLAYAKRRGRIEHNRALGISALYRSDRRERTWSPDDEAKFLEVAAPALQLALILAVECGQSQGDLLSMPWSAIQGPILVSRRNKTKVPVAVPISARLAEALEAAPKGRAVTILTKADGLPWEPKGNGFRAAWQAASHDAGIVGLTFNDLRGTFITRRRSGGWTAEEVALCSGHPIAGEKGAMTHYVDRLVVAKASALRIAAREQSGDESCKPDGKPQKGEATK